MRTLPMLLVVVLSTGCASIVTGSKSTVTFKSDPPGATVRVYNRINNKLYQGVTPCQATFRSTRYTYTADFDMDGYHTYTESFSGSLNPWLFGNIVPVIGLPIGLILDFALGSAYQLPEEVSCRMQPGTSAGRTPDRRPIKPFR